MNNVFILPGIPKLLQSMVEYQDDIVQGPRIHRIIVKFKKKVVTKIKANV